MGILAITGTDFVDRREYIDLGVFFFFGLIHFLAWREAEKPVNNEAIRSAAQAGITALGILIAASFIVLQLTSADNALPDSVAADVFFASLWFLAALASGLYVIWRLAMYTKQYSEVIFDVGVVFGFQLLASLIGVGRLIVSVMGLP